MAIFDSHLHIIDPAYPLIENQGYLPDAFTVADYLKRVRPLGIEAGAVVSGSFQGFDQTYLVDALDQLGDNYVGVTQLPASVSDDELANLHEAGVRALRFNVRRGGSESISELGDFALRVFDQFKWHVELYAGFDALHSLKDTILKLPKVSVDHLGLNKAGLPLLTELAAQGCYVKATGFGRIDFNPHEAMRSLYDANPNALVFGTDLPCTRAPQPFEDSHLYQLSDAFSEQEIQNITWQNGLRLYNLECS